MFYCFLLFADCGRLLFIAKAQLIVAEVIVIWSNMARGTAPRVRLVKCPKCRLLLPEVEDVPVYKCGGCDTILVAKNRKAIVENTSLLQETPAAGSDILVQVSEDGESSSSSPQEVHLSREVGSRSGKLDENLSTGGHYNDQNKSGDTDYKREKLDENGSNEGLQNGSRRLKLEPSEHCKVSIEAEENNKTLRLEGAYLELKTTNEIASNIRGSSFDDPCAAREAAGEVTSSDNFFSSPNEHMEQPWSSEHRGFDHVRSIDSLGSLDYFSPSSELSDPDLESTATRTSHAYDGSMSSYDGMDDQFLVPVETLKRDKMLANGLMTCNARNRSLNLSAKKRYGTTKSSKCHRDEALDPAMHQRLPRNQTKLVRDEYRSRIPFSQRAYESAGPSHDEFHEYREHENMKLLRMVHELQDQISKTCNLNGRISRGRASIDTPCRQKHFPTYYYPEEENFYPRPWPRSEQLPPPMFRHNRGFYRHHSGLSCYNCNNYYPSSPQRYFESDFSRWSHKFISGDHKSKRYPKEKHNSIKRQCRAMAGGAPFVTCYHCFKPLELPTDFQLSEKRFHQLRCGACLKVLTFSLRNGIHIIPYEPVGSRNVDQVKSRPAVMRPAC
ncbi:hypothetical protein PVK06_046242 [Gossypium arboreum]|uniref:Zinc-ribbon domain-containing protein n=1 Tax=Gossypium arboreum TaxID=29729 RepID=A0ABR0MAE5_GOSAR|nr:hypothetical protein PVK06_046242 [Gossypium arboreum]